MSAATPVDARHCGTPGNEHEQPILGNEHEQPILATMSHCHARSRIFVSLTTVPARLARHDALLEVLRSLKNQLPMPESVILHVPQRYARWPNTTFELPGALTALPWLKISRPASDEGPSTKVLGLRLATHRGAWDPDGLFIQGARKDDIVVFTDDDSVKHPGWLGNLTCTLQMGTVAGYRSHPLESRSPPGGIVMGWLGFGWHLGTIDLSDLQHFHWLQAGECSRVDDHMLTAYFHMRQVLSSRVSPRTYPPPPRT